jgi:hypothetical protein
MHKCLLISEIVTRVCLGLCCDSDSYYGRQYAGSLAAFAITCRAISEPALDVLWHTQYSIAPLLRCMSSDLWEERDVDGETFLVCYHSSFVANLTLLRRSYSFFDVSP